MGWEKRMEDLLREQGVEEFPAHVRLAFGRDSLEDHIGKKRVHEAIASTDWGIDGRRKVPRATWDTYCYRDDEGFVVACLNPETVRKSGYQAWPAVEAAIKWAAHLATGGNLYDPGEIVWAVDDWHTYGSVLAIDTEGVGTVDRVSLAVPGSAGSFQWDGNAAALTHSLVQSADIILMHNAPHDTALLAEMGVFIPRAKIRDTMLTHGLVHPWRQVGLGKVAQLHAPIEPWKHLSGNDMETYSMLDAAYLIPLWKGLETEIQRRKLERVVLRQHDLMWRLHEKVGHAGRTRVVHRMGGVESYLTRAAGLLESDPPPYPQEFLGQLDPPRVAPAGFHACRLRDPLVQIAGVLARCPDLDFGDSHPEIARRWLAGLGPRQARNGLTGRAAPIKLGPAAPPITEREIKEQFATLNSLYPAIYRWQVDVARHAKRDKYVATSSGRRAYGLREPVLFLLLASVADAMQRAITDSGITPEAMCFGMMLTHNPDDAAALAKACPLACEVL